MMKVCMRHRNFLSSFFEDRRGCFIGESYALATKSGNTYLVMRARCLSCGMPLVEPLVLPKLPYFVRRGIVQVAEI